MNLNGSAKTNKRAFLFLLTPLLVVMAWLLGPQATVINAQAPTGQMFNAHSQPVLTETYVATETHIRTVTPVRSETRVFITRTATNTRMPTETHRPTGTHVPITRTAIVTPGRTETHVYITRTATSTRLPTETHMPITRTTTSTPTHNETPERTETRVYVTRTATNTRMPTETHRPTETRMPSETHVYITRTATNTPASSETHRPTETRMPTRTITATHAPETPRATRTGTQVPGPVPTWVCGRVTWTNLANVTATENTIRKTGGASGNWDAGAVSSQVIQHGDALVQVTVVETNTYAMFGLSQLDTPAGMNMDFALAMGGGTLAVFEGGTLKGAFGSYNVGDALRIVSVGGVVRYFHNDTLLYTSTVAPHYPMRVVAAINTMGGRIANAYLCRVSSLGGASHPDEGR